ncbi:hypothetical protein BTUL_0275g00040 [Botrytis tulipae]|uniref:Uncharacterized protein n=1 Tax=Botrytis tulipae TaxID=87230 RepID=A0A4Z1E9I4_9HELO|nr:hypothetical protein BTUL_0275g00040 [Botrytis tulipae]
MHTNPANSEITVAANAEQQPTVPGALGALRIQTNIDNGKKVEVAKPQKQSARPSNSKLCQRSSLYPIIEWFNIPDANEDSDSKMSIDAACDTQALESQERQDEAMNETFQQIIIAGPAGLNEWPSLLDATRQQNTTAGLSQSLPQSDTAASAAAKHLQVLTYFHDWNKQYNRTLKEAIEETHKIRDYVREYTLSAGSRIKIASQIFDADSKLIQEYRDWNNDYKHLVARYHSIMNQHATLCQIFDDRHSAETEEDPTTGYTSSNDSNADPHISSQNSAGSSSAAAVNLGTILHEDLMDGLTTNFELGLTQMPSTASPGPQIDYENFRLCCRLNQCDYLTRLRAETTEKLASLRILAARLLEDDDFRQESHMHTLWFNCQAKIFSIAEDLERLEIALKEFGS